MYRHITTVIVTLNTPNNLEHVRIFIPPSSDTRDPGNTRTSYVGYRSLCRRLVTSFFYKKSPSFLYRKSPCLHYKRVHISSNKKVHLSSTGKVHVYITRKSIFPLTRKSIRLLEILHKNVLCLRYHRNIVVKPRWWLAFAHRSTQIWQYVLHDRRGVRLGDAITQRNRRIITFWR